MRFSCIYSSLCNTIVFYKEVNKAYLLASTQLASDAPTIFGTGKGTAKLHNDFLIRTTIFESKRSLSSHWTQLLFSKQSFRWVHKLSHWKEGLDLFEGLHSRPVL